MLGQTTPSEGFSTFVDAFTSYLSASTSILVEILLTRFNSNDSISRGAFLFFGRAAWTSHRLVGVPVPNIDPVRAATADRQQVEIGATTFDRVARETNESSESVDRRQCGREFGELLRAPWEKGIPS